MIKTVLIATCALGIICLQPAIAADMPVKAPVMMTSAPAPFASRWYVEGRLGGPLLKNYDINIVGSGPGSYEPDSGFHGAIDVGYEFAPNWRAELEFTWTRGRDGNVNLAGFNFPHAGTTNVYTFGVNGFYMFNFSPMFRPFIGAGVGIATYDVNNLGAIGGGFVVDDSDTTVVLALHAGVDVPITRAIALTGRYTLAHTGSMTFGSRLIGGGAGPNTSRDSTFDNIFTAGLRVYLN